MRRDRSPYSGGARIVGRRSASLAGVALILWSVLPASAVHAQTPRWSDPELERFSRVIVAGRVVAVAPGRDPSAPDGIYTYVEIEVDEVVKGWVPDGRLVVKQLGGRLGDLELVVGDQPEFRIGEEALLFLEARPRDGTLYTTALWQGKWQITRDPANGEGVATRRPPAPRNGAGREPRRLSDPAAAAQDVRLLRPFLAELRAWAGPDARRPPREPLTLLPAETPPAGVEDGRGTPGGSSFTLLGAARWRQVDGGEPVILQVDNDGQPGLAGGGFGEIDGSRALWNGGGSALVLAAGGTRGARCFNTYEGDGRLSIAFMDPCKEIDDSGGTLAIGGFFSSYSTADETTVNGTTFRRILQGMIVSNDSSTALAYLQVASCFRDIFTHEIGHAVGLGHTSVSGNIMLPNIDGSCRTAGVSAGLGPEDIAGIRYVYPMPELAPSTPATIAPSGTLAGSAPIYQWDAVAGADRYQLHVIRTGVRAVYSDVHRADDICTAATCALDSPPVPVLDPGDYVWRVRALNGAGTGEWSAFVSFSITAPVPAAALLIGPEGAIDDRTPSYSWNEVSGATRYQLHIIEVGVRAIHASVYDAAALCSGGVCSVDSPPVEMLKHGRSYIWRVRGLNGSGAGDWSPFQSFSVD